MPIKLVDDNTSHKFVSLLDDVAFFNNEDGTFFILSDSNGHEIRVEYIPQFISGWDPDRYISILFENPYLTAENDIFELYINNIEGRLGWICPITSLDSNENNYANDKSFKHYRYVAYWKLLQSDFQVKYQESKQEYNLSEIFPNLFICILSKEEVAKIPDFKIDDYALSFLNYDYLIFNNNIKGIKVFNKDDFVETLRKSNHQIRIKKSSFDITKNQFTKSLFLEHLYQSESFLIRYILLYQILEHFIQEIADKILEESIKSYQEKKISKNAFREKITRFSNDRSLLKKVFEKSIIKKETRLKFFDKCTFLFNDIGEEIDNNFDDALYDLRNLITHRYRDISNKTAELKEIVYLFEIIIIELLITFNAKTGSEVEEENVEAESHGITAPNKKKGVKGFLINIWNRTLQSLLISE